MPLKCRLPEWYGWYWSLADVFDKEKGGFSWDEVVTKVVKRLAVIDGIDEENQKKITDMINVVFDDGDVLTSQENVISRYKLEKPLTASNLNYICNQLYDCAKEFWMKTRFFNASMSWDSLNNLLSKETRRNYLNKRDYTNNTKGTESSKGDGTSEAKQNSDVNTKEDVANYDAASNADGTLRDNNFLAGGVGRDSDVKNNSNEDSSYNANVESSVDRTNDFKGTTDGEWEESVQQVKFQYLDKIYGFIDENQFLSQNFVADFINALIMPMQNLDLSFFPWPWDFSNRRLQ